MKLSTLFLAFLVFGINSFSQVTTIFAKQNYAKHFNKKSIPSDIKKNGHILRIASPFTEKQEKLNEEIRIIFETFYKGKFVLIPNGAKTGKGKDYEDKNIYKYMIIILPKTEEKIHLHYSIALVDLAAYQSDSNQYIDTGLDDDDKKLNEMLTFYAQKLGEAEE